MDSQLAVNSSIIPIDILQLSLPLDGSSGSNRARNNHPQISARNDIDALKAWLARFADTRTTFESYRKEAERLLLWSVTELAKPISSLTHEDLLIYQRFLSDPQPASRWVMSKRKASRGDPDWKPFAGPLSPTSQRQTIVILNGLFSWLVNAGYLAGNPLSLSRQRQRKAKTRITRLLDDDLWNEVKQTIEHLPRETRRQREHYYRARWLFSLLYMTGLRASEVVQNTMGGFLKRKDRDGEDQWWLEITGKGDKCRWVPAPQDLLIELQRYRREIGLNPWPIEGELVPLLLPIGGKQRFMTRAAVHLILKQIFALTAERLKQRGPESSGQVARLEAASTHWMRHTAASNMVSVMDLHYVRDNLGHSSIATTNNYLHTEDDNRHQYTEERYKLNW